jgi:hypothetical protein
MGKGMQRKFKFCLNVQTWLEFKSSHIRDFIFYVSLRVMHSNMTCSYYIRYKYIRMILYHISKTEEEILQK